MLTWLHRLGYVTTVIVVAELLAVAILCAHLWEKDRQGRAFARERTRTHQGSIVAEVVRYRPDEINLLSTLPPRSEDSLRFVAMPSLRDQWFAMALFVPAKGNRARGVIKVFSHPTGQEESLTTLQTARFSMSLSSAQHFLADFDRATRDWEGEALHCLDGTSVAFELATGGKETSGAGNSACSQHYGRISLMVLDRLGYLFPEDKRPAGKDWRPAFRAPQVIERRANS